MEDAHCENTVPLGDIAQPLSDFVSDLRATDADSIFPGGINNPKSLCGAKEAEGAVTAQKESLEPEAAVTAEKEALNTESAATAQNEVLETEEDTTAQREILELEGGAAVTENEAVTPQQSEETDDGDGEYLNVLELDEEPNIYIDLKEDENDAVIPQETEEIHDGDGEYLNVLELDEEQNIYIELKGDED